MLFVPVEEYPSEDTASDPGTLCPPGSWK